VFADVIGDAVDAYVQCGVVEVSPHSLVQLFV